MVETLLHSALVCISTLFKRSTKHETLESFLCSAMKRARSPDAPEGVGPPRDPPSVAPRPPPPLADPSCAPGDCDEDEVLSRLTCLR